MVSFCTSLCKTTVSIAGPTAAPEAADEADLPPLGVVDPSEEVSIPPELNTIYNEGGDPREGLRLAYYFTWDEAAISDEIQAYFGNIILPAAVGVLHRSIRVRHLLPPPVPRPSRILPQHNTSIEH